MKKTVLFMMLVVFSSLLVTSCRSMRGGDVPDSTFKRIYERYFSGLILEGARTHTVRAGDTLVQISSTYYGNGFYYPIIMLASRDVVLDPDKIQPGMQLTIPDLQRNLADTRARASVKGVILECADIDERRGRADTAAELRRLSNSL